MKVKRESSVFHLLEECIGKRKEKSGVKVKRESGVLHLLEECIGKRKETSPTIRRKKRCSIHRRPIDRRAANDKLKDKCIMLNAES